MYRIINVAPGVDYYKSISDEAVAFNGLRQQLYEKVALAVATPARNSYKAKDYRLGCKEHHMQRVPARLAALRAQIKTVVI